MTDQVRTGGCQCGAIRYRIRGKLGHASICHCRMCQKQFGSLFGAFVTVPGDGVEWVREEPAYFQSSVNIARGFCRRCGTPMTYRHPEGLELSLGSFDERADLIPIHQVNHGARLPWVDRLFEAPPYDNPDYDAQQERVISFQHPDHETPVWPAQGLKL